mgnify:CR=1 FL=1
MNLFDAKNNLFVSLLSYLFNTSVSNNFFAFCDVPTPPLLASETSKWSVLKAEPATPLMEGIIALHSDIWAIMLFVAFSRRWILSKAV